MQPPIKAMGTETAMETATTDEGVVHLPYKFTPRPYQCPVMDAVTLGYKRVACVWNRRAGKDKTFLNIVAREMARRVGSYSYFFPEQNQGRKVLWQGMDRDGFPFLGHFPPELIKKKRDTDMLIEYFNGSIFQIIGTDKWDSSMGTGSIFQVYSEYSLQNPAVWQYFQPILMENDGTALFNWTPRGKNHAWELENIAKADPARWFFDSQNVDQTKSVTKEQIEQARRDGMTQDMIDQEFYLSYEAANPGAYFREEMLAAKNQGRICRIPIETALPVYTFWDLGMDDSTTIWLAQMFGKERRAVGYYENSGLALSHYINWLAAWQQEHSTRFETHVLPHDGEVTDLTSGKSRKQVLQEARIGNVVCAKRPARKEDAIEVSRQMIGRVWFDSEACDQGIECLRNYRKEYNEERGVFRMQPVHDKFSHGADGFQTWAIWDVEYVKTQGQSTFDASKCLGQSARMSAQPQSAGGWML